MGLGSSLQWFTASTNTPQHLLLTPPYPNIQNLVPAPAQAQVLYISVLMGHAYAHLQPMNMDVGSSPWRRRSSILAISPWHHLIAESLHLNFLVIAKSGI